MSTSNINGNNKIRLKCSCGKKLAVKAQYAGKSLKCPACGNEITIPCPPIPPMSQEAVQSTRENNSDKLSRNSIYLMSSIVGVFALGCILFVILHQYSANQDKIREANIRISEVSNKVSNWLDKEPRQFDESLQSELTEVLASEYATETKEAESILEKLNTYQKQLQTETIYQEAIDKLRERKPDEAIVLLKKYKSSEYARQQKAAQILIKEIEIATSEDLMYEKLINMSEDEFNRATLSGIIKYEKVTHPQLQIILKDTLNKTQDRASKERDSRKIAMENKLKQEKQEAMELQRLRTRPTNVRNVCWGDSRETVRKAEEIDLVEENDGLKATVELAGKKATLYYTFYDNKLVEVYYVIKFDRSGNPFSVDPTIRVALEEKYGEPKGESYGITTLGIDMSHASRSFKWNLIDQTIELSAMSEDMSFFYRSLILSYKANSSEYKAYEEAKKNESIQQMKQRRDTLKKNL